MDNPLYLEEFSNRRSLDVIISSKVRDKLEVLYKLNSEYLTHLTNGSEHYEFIYNKQLFLEQQLENKVINLDFNDKVLFDDEIKEDLAAV